MSVAEPLPFTTQGDAAIPVGTVFPGVIKLDRPQEAANESIGLPRRAAGRWTLEVVRRLRMDSACDVALKTGVLMWVAAFDHSEKAPLPPRAAHPG